MVMTNASTLGGSPGAAAGGPELPPPYDEAIASTGEPRPHYAELLAALEAAGPAKLAARLGEATEHSGLSFSGNRFLLDPLPRLLEAGEWELITRAASQRASALDRFCADAYGAREIVAAGIVPERVITGAELYEPAMTGVPVAAGGWATVVGLDLVRGPEGDFLVLEDNARSPSGLSFALAARRALSLVDLPGEPLGDPGEAFDALGQALRAAAPAAAGEPSVALFSEGEDSAASFEHALIAERLGIPIVTAGELERSGARLHSRIGGERREIDVLYRRIDGERLSEHAGRPTEFGSLLTEPLQEGTLAVANAFGSGVADDKLTHAYVDEAIRFYLGEEPVIASVPTFDLGDPGQRAEALERLGELVVKPRSGLGGGGVLIGPLASAEERAAVRADIEADPGRFIAQETVSLSTHPSAVGDRLEPRRIDLRPYAISVGPEVHVPRAALTRFAPAEGELIVNSSRGGGAKDTWVLSG